MCLCLDYFKVILSIKHILEKIYDFVYIFYFEFLFYHNFRLRRIKFTINRHHSPIIILKFLLIIKINLRAYFSCIWNIAKAHFHFQQSRYTLDDRVLSIDHKKHKDCQGLL